MNPVSANTCNDTDGGLNIYLRGTVSGFYGNESYSYTDFCSAGILNEFWCNNGTYSQYTAACPANYSCSNGACVQNQTNSTCYDSDGGQNFFTYGYTSQGDNYQYDQCSSDRHLLEQFCLAGGQSATTADCYYLGNYHCVGGKCIANNQTNQTHKVCQGTGCVTVSGPGVDECTYNYECQGNQTNQTNTCSDSDGGFKVYVVGIVSGLFNGQPYSYTDYCINTTGLINEYWCQNNTGEWRATVGGCPNGYECNNGACKAKAVPAKNIYANRNNKAVQYSPGECTGFWGWMKRLFGGC